MRPIRLSLTAARLARLSGGSTGGSSSPVGPDPNFYVFLLLGQSNMEGAPAPEARDIAEDPRIRVLTYDASERFGRKYNQWHIASPPLHSQNSGVGPGDYFGRTLIAALPSHCSIGLVPCAINGVDIDFFRKGVRSQRRLEFIIPPDDHWTGAYEWVIERARVAQQFGVVRGILFHQGESDSCDATWLEKVKGMVGDLRTDLSLAPEVPFLVGELYHDGECSSHNRLVHQLPNHVANTRVISASGLHGMDPFHFDLESQRSLGVRYAQAMCTALGLA